METGTIFTSILGSMGGSALVIGCLAGWLGKVWATRIETSLKAAYEQELTRLKSSLEQELTRLKSSLDIDKTRIETSLKAAYEQELTRLKSSLEIEKARVENTLNRLAETQKQLLSTSVEIDLDLRKRRLDVYPEVWEKTEMLPKWPRKKDVTYNNLYEFSKSLRDWYFNTGGMFLSRSTHKNAYSPLQDAIADILEKNPATARTLPLKDEDYDAIRGKCSTLRTNLTNDILSRRAVLPELK